jgi:hypothetical protein
MAIWSARPALAVVIVSSFPIARKLVANRRYDGSILLLGNFNLLLVDPPQVHLIQFRIA